MSQTSALAAYHNNKAIELSLEGQFTEALEHVDIALRYTSGFATIQNKGKIYLRRKDFDKSIEILQLALSRARVNEAKSEEIADIELDLSDAFAKKGNLEKAREHFRNFLKLTGTSKKINNVLVNEKQSDKLNEAELEYATSSWLMQASNCKEAIGCLEKSYATFKALGNQERAYKIQYEIGNAYMSLDNLEDARRYYRSYVEDKGTEVHQLHELVEEHSRKKMIDAEVENLIGSWLTRAGSFEEALEHYHLARKLYKPWFVPQYNIAKTLFLMGNMAACAYWCKYLIRKSTKFGFTVEERAQVSALFGDYYANVGKLKKAVKEYRTSVQKHSLESHRKELAHLELKLIGYSRHKMGDYENAIVFYIRSLDLSPNDGELYFNIGRCYYKQKNLKEAANYYDKSMRCDPIRFIKLNKRLSKKRWTNLFSRF